MSNSFRNQISSSGRDADPRRPSTPQMPSFLQSTRADIHSKFVDLEWQQRDRLAPHNPSTAPPEFVRLSGAHIAALNRYIDIDPYSGNRVKLKVPKGQNDYINASPISLHHTGTSKVRRYIATQGPTEESTAHFWRMLYHSSPPHLPTIIIMLTQLKEAGREKCFPYFPLSASSPTMKINAEDEFRDGETATVTLVKTEENRRARCLVRTLKMVVAGRTKTVYHLAFAAWPDFLVPEGEDRAALVELVRLSVWLNRQGQGQEDHAGDGEEANPRIVHCSAGVGRSGTFIALDFLLGELEDGALDRVPDGVDAIAETVGSLRVQRMMMVQGEGQMRFLYEVLRELWVARQVYLGDRERRRSRG